MIGWAVLGNNLGSCGEGSCNFPGGVPKLELGNQGKHLTAPLPARGLTAPRSERPLVVRRAGRRGLQGHGDGTGQRVRKRPNALRRHYQPIYTGLGSDVSFSKAGKMPALQGKSAHEMRLFTLNRYRFVGSLAGAFTLICTHIAADQGRLWHGQKVWARDSVWRVAAAAAMLPKEAAACRARGGVASIAAGSWYQRLADVPKRGHAPRRHPARPHGRLSESHQGFIMNSTKPVGPRLRVGTRFALAMGGLPLSCAAFSPF